MQPVSCTAASSAGAEPGQADVDAFAANISYQMAEDGMRGRPGDADPPGVLRDHNSTVWKTYGSGQGL